MRLEPNELRFGVKPEILIDCADQLCQGDGHFNFAEFCKALGAPERESLPVLHELIANGFVKDAEPGSEFQTMKSLTQLAQASVTKGISRAESRELVKAICAKAEELKADPATYPYAPACLVAFGSYLTDAPILGDVDIGVELRRARDLTEKELDDMVSAWRSGRATSESRT